MPRISLSEIQFRPYSENEDITTFGPNDYSPTAGAIHLNNIKFRPWMLSDVTPGSSQTGGGGGGGGTGTPGDPGLYSMLATGTNAEAHWDFPSAQNACYASVWIYLTTAQKASIMANGTAYTGEFLDLSKFWSDGPYWLDWGGMYMMKSGGDLYFTDYYGAFWPTPVQPNTWYNIELAVKQSAGPYPYEESWKVDGVQNPEGWMSFNDFGILTGTGMDRVYVGDRYSIVSDKWYLDNVQVSFTDWVSSGGAIVFEDGFESNDFSAWTGTSGTPTLAAAP